MSPRSDDRRLVRGPSFWPRWATADFRRLPDFWIIGAMKAGTSSLFHYICQHPDIRAPFRKETHYLGYGQAHGRSERWYRAHFPLRTRPGSGSSDLTGEATPGYMFRPEIAPLIKRMRPDAKLIVVLRDPVERAISQYFHEVRMGRERLPIEEAMLREDERLAHARACGAAGHETLLHASYKARSRYAEQLGEWLAHFPQDQILILWTRDLANAPEQTMERTFGFLGLSMPDRPLEFAVRNAAPRPAEVPEGVRAHLRRHFAPHDAQLGDMLGCALPW